MKSVDREMPRQKGILIRAEPDVIEKFNTVEVKNKFPFHEDTLKALLANSAEVFIDFQKCEFFKGECLKDRRLINCDKSGEKLQFEREYCRGCRQDQITQVPLKKKERIEQEISTKQGEISKAQETLDTVKADIATRKKESEDIYAKIREGKNELEKIRDFAKLPEQLQNSQNENQRLREDHKKDISDLNQQHHKEIDELNQEHEKAVDVLKKEYDDKLQKKDTTIKELQDTLEFNATLAKNEKPMEKEKTVTQGAKSDVLTEIETDLKKRIEQSQIGKVGPASKAEGSS